MSRRDKLIQRLLNSPHDIRFSELEALLRHEGYALFNQKGSHCTYHREGGKLITVVKPHGGRKTCHPADVRKLLGILNR